MFIITINASNWAEALGKLMQFLLRRAGDPNATDPDVEIKWGGGGP